MNLIKTLFSLFKKVENLSVNESPLHFTQEAILQIQKHLDSRPSNIKSAFKVEIVYNKENINCGVGFDDYKMLRKTIYQYPVPLIIAEEDEIFLRGSYIDYHTEEEAYFYYPNVHLEVKERSKDITVFYLDRNVISPSSIFPNFSLDNKNYNESFPLLVRKLFMTGLVESIYMEKNFISIEKIKTVSIEELEEKMSDIIFSYFETCGYPLFITDNSVEAKRIAKV